MFVTVARIQAEVAKSFDIPVDVMTAKFTRGEGRNGRNKIALSHARQVAMYLAYEVANKQKTSIGRLFGGRDHTTVIHAIEVVRQRLESSELLRQRVESIRTSLFLPPAPPPPAKPPAEQSLHWKERQEAERKSFSTAYTQMMRGICFEPKVREEDRVRRDPCIKCGARGDIGCVHTRVAA